MDQTDEEVQETHVCGQRAVALVEDKRFSLALLREGAIC